MGGPCAGHDNLDPSGLQYHWMKEHEPADDGHDGAPLYWMVGSRRCRVHRCKHCHCLYVEMEDKSDD